MRVEELRIGNYIKTDDDIICIVSRIESKDYTHWNSGECFSITALELNTEDDYLNVRNDKWQPIELTEEILLKCGFEKGYTKGVFKLGDFTIDFYSKTFKFKREWIDINFKYLHQLQNLYYALCNEELNVQL